MGLKFETSDEALSYVRSQTDRVICPFSRGKDSLAAYLNLLRFWEPDQIVLVHHGLPKGPDGITRMDFIESSIRYYERKLNKRVYRLFHVVSMKLLYNGLWQSPDRMPVLSYMIDEGLLAANEVQFMNDRCRIAGWENAYVATGLRVTDSLQRRATILHNGSVYPDKKLCYPIWDWPIARVEQVIRDAGLKLPVDYIWFGRSFDAWTAREFTAIRDHSPSDYESAKVWFPLLDADLFRYEQRTRLLAEQAERDRAQAE